MKVFRQSIDEEFPEYICHNSDEMCVDWLTVRESISSHYFGDMCILYYNYWLQLHDAVKSQCIITMEGLAQTETQLFSFLTFWLLKMIHMNDIACPM